MTLNVTVLTSGIIYQSADFRLTDFDSGEPMTDPSPKTVSLTYSAWNGFVTYTGVGRWQHRDVSDLITGWLTGQDELSMAEVANIVADKGSRLLREFERAYYRRSRHTFTLSGFEQHQPNVYVISNFEDCFGNSRNVIDDHLSVTHRPLGNTCKALVIVTGCKRAVAASDKRLLGRVAAKFPDDGLRLRRRMAQLNSDAAARSDNKVSPECVVLSLSTDGAGAMLLDPDAEKVPRQFPGIMFGIDVNSALSEALRNLGIDSSNTRVVQVGYRSIQPDQPPARSPRPCKYAIVTRDVSDDYELTELINSEFELGNARDISDRGQIVGTGRSSPGSYPHIPWSYIDGHIEILNFPGPLRQ